MIQGVIEPDLVDTYSGSPLSSRMKYVDPTLDSDQTIDKTGYVPSNLTVRLETGATSINVLRDLMSPVFRWGFEFPPYVVPDEKGCMFVHRISPTLFLSEIKS